MAITLVAEDGTGLSTANVYDLAAACETWLSDRGYTVYAAGTSAEKDRWLLEATEEMERRSHWRVAGAPISGDDQSMIWPRSGSVDARYRRHDTDERPAAYREGIFLLAEDIAVAAGSSDRISDLDERSYLRSERVEGVALAYRRPVTFSDVHQAAMKRAAEAWPAALRSARA